MSQEHVVTMNSEDATYALLKAKLDDLPFESEVRNRFCESIRRMDDSEASSLCDLLDKAQSILHSLFLNESSFTVGASQQVSCQETEKEAEKKYPTSSKYEYRGKPAWREIRREIATLQELISKSPPSSFFEYVNAFLCELEKLAYITGDPQPLLNAVIRISQSLLLSLKAHKELSIELSDKILLQALAWYPRQPTLWALWASCRVANSSYDDAKLVFVEGLRRNPSSHHLAARFGHFLCDRVGDYMTAKSVIENVLHYRNAIPPSKGSSIHDLYFYVIIKDSILLEVEILIERVRKYLLQYGVSSTTYGFVTLLVDAEPNILNVDLFERMFRGVNIDKHWAGATLSIISRFNERYRVFLQLKKFFEGRKLIDEDSMLVVPALHKYPREFQERRSAGRGFEFSKEDQINTAILGDISPEIEYMAKLKLAFCGGDFATIRRIAAEIQRTAPGTPADTYARVLIIRGGDIVEVEGETEEFATRFESALRSGNIRTLELLMRHYPKRRAMCLVARSIFGDREAYHEIETICATPQNLKLLNEIDMESLLNTMQLWTNGRIVDLRTFEYRRDIAKLMLSDLNDNFI